MERRFILVRRNGSFVICLWLTLATVFGHALAPLGSPLVKRSGSAFSASTTDVSIIPSRRGTPAKLKKQLGVSAEEAPLVSDNAGGAALGPPAVTPAFFPQLLPIDAVEWASQTFRPNRAAFSFRSRAPPLA